MQAPDPNKSLLNDFVCGEGMRQQLGAMSTIHIEEKGQTLLEVADEAYDNSRKHLEERAAELGDTAPPEDDLNEVGYVIADFPDKEVYRYRDMVALATAHPGKRPLAEVGNDVALHLFQCGPVDPTLSTPEAEE